MMETFWEKLGEIVKIIWSWEIRVGNFTSDRNYFREILLRFWRRFGFKIFETNLKKFWTKVPKFYINLKNSGGNSKKINISEEILKRCQDE